MFSDWFGKSELEKQKEEQVKDNNEKVVQEQKEEDTKAKKREESNSDAFMGRVTEDNQRFEKDKKLTPKGNEYNLNNQSTINLKVNESDVPYNMDEIMNLRTPEIRSVIRRADSEEEIKEVVKEISKQGEKSSREDAVFSEALRYGAQSALYARTYNIKRLLDQNQLEMSRIYNFSPLLLANGRVVPPIISESDKQAMTENKYTLRSVDKSYKIIEQARVLNQPLTWRTYLITDVGKPIQPDPVLLPLNKREDAAWKKGIKLGWQNGLIQANDIFLDKIRTLTRDYIGMVRFHLMLDKNIIKNPITIKTPLGVTGNDTDLNLNEVIFEIAEIPKFNKDAETWNALPNIESYIKLDDDDEQ